MSVVDRDKPVLDAEAGTLCSPSCGCHCTVDAFVDATVQAEQLAERLGGDWAPVVWENCGWNWHVENGEVSITPGDKRYLCSADVEDYPDPDHPGNVATALQFHGQGDTPEQALQRCVSAMEEQRNNMEKIIKRIKGHSA
jgi:hypothetical protein